MAKVICVMGESGSGKTTSLRNLPPEETLYIDCDGKGLSWKGWRKQYNTESKNYAQIYKPSAVMSLLVRANNDDLHAKYVVVDTLNGIMVGDEMDRAKEKGYDKWQDLAQSVYAIVNFALHMRDDMTVIFLAHTETVNEDNGYTITRIRTSGKKLQKIVLESKFTTVLLAKCVDGKYLFETQARNSTAKSPMGAFEEFEIENDMVEVLKALDEF